MASNRGRNRKQSRARRKPGEALRVAMCCDTRDAPMRERLRGCYQYALERNWRIHLFRQDNNDEIARVLDTDIDGAIVYDRSRPFQQALKSKGIVCVEMGARHLDLSDAAVFMDDDAMVRMMLGHLRSVGFEKFAYCGLAGSHPSAMRAAHLREHTNGEGRVFEERWRDGEMDIAPLMRWLRALPKPVGVLTFDCNKGARVLTACRWAGIRVPDEVGVIGIGFNARPMRV